MQLTFKQLQQVNALAARNKKAYAIELDSVGTYITATAVFHRETKDGIQVKRGETFRLWE